MLINLLTVGSEIIGGISVSHFLIYAAAALIVITITTYYLLKHNYYKIRDIPQPQRRFIGPEDDRILIVGSGVVGSALGAVLARDGRKVTIIERDLKEPDRIVGELMQPGGLNALRSLGLGDCAEGIDAATACGYVVHELESGTTVEIPYPEESSGCGFHHGRFIMALRKAAMKEKNVTYIEGTASKLLEDNGVVVGLQYREKGSEEAKEIFAPLTIVADGCFSRFRKQLVKESPKLASHFVGILMKDCPQFLPDHCDLVLAKPSPILVYRVSSSYTRVLVDIRGNIPSDLKGHLMDFVAPQMPDHLRGPFEEAIVNGHVRTMPNRFLPPSPVEQPGALALGDAFNMRHPLTGGGMSVALNDILIWRDLFKQVKHTADYQTILHSFKVFHAKRKSTHSFAVNILSMALYQLFAANDEQSQCLKKACFAYFKLGGQCIAGPVGLLSVLHPVPHLLIGHFFAVALYAVYSIFKTEPFWAVHRSVSKSIRVFYSACNIIFPLIWSELKTLLFV